MRPDDIHFFSDQFTTLNNNVIKLLQSHAETKKDIEFIKDNISNNSLDLKEHIKRTELNEKRIEHVENLMINLIKPKGFWNWLRKNYKFILGIASLISLFITVLSLLSILFKTYIL